MGLPIALVVGVLGASVGCGAADTGADESGTREGDTAAEPRGAMANRGPVVRRQRLAARLVVAPGRAAPGQALRISVANVGSRTVMYGLRNTVERRAGTGQWRSAMRAVYGTRRPGVRLIRLRAEPGQRGGPDYGTVVDRIRLPCSLKRGLYRVSKRVSGRPKERPSVVLRVRFQVAGQSSPRCQRQDAAGGGARERGAAEVR